MGQGLGGAGPPGTQSIIFLATRQSGTQEGVATPRRRGQTAEGAAASRAKR